MGTASGYGLSDVAFTEKNPAGCSYGSVPLSDRSAAGNVIFGLRSRRAKALAAADVAHVDGIREGMSVVSADGCCVGFVNGLNGEGMLRMVAINAAGHGFDHLVPLSWVRGVDKYVHLDKTRAYIAANSRH